MGCCHRGGRGTAKSRWAGDGGLRTRHRHSSSGDPTIPQVRDNLYWRDVVDSRKDGIARVLLGGKTTVTVRELTRLELREEKRAEGIRYVADLVSGKVRASVARMLMRPGEQVEVWTWNAVASVRGTDFIVEAVERPAQAGAFGLLGGREVAQGVGDSATKSRETVVITLSGLVDVSNPLAGTARSERIGAYEAARVSGNQDPVRLQVSADQMKVYLRGLTLPLPQQARSGDKAEAVGSTVEQVAVAASSESARALEGDGSFSGGNGDGKGKGNGLALGQLNVGGNLGGKSSELGLGNPNLAKDIGKGKKK